MTATDEDVTLCVLLEAARHCDYKRNPLFLRLAVNGVLQADIVSKRISGIDGMFVVMVRLPGGVKNIAMLQMGTSKNEHMAKIAPNNHIVDIENDTLLLMRWGKQLQKLHLSPGKQLMFILPDIGKDTLAVQGSIRPLSCWKDALDLYSFHIPNTATLLAMPIQQRKKSLAFKLVRLPANASGWSDGMEWEQPLHKNKTASLSESTEVDVIVSRWNDSSVQKTEVYLSLKGYRVRNADTVMQSIFKSTSDMYKCINDIPLEVEEENTKASKDGEARNSENDGEVKTSDGPDSTTKDDVQCDAVDSMQSDKVNKEPEESKPAILDVLQASDVGEILSFACSCETIATTVNQDSLSIMNDVAPMLKDSDGSVCQDDLRTLSLHGDTAQKAANENTGGAMSPATDETTMTKGTRLPSTKSTMSAPVNKVYTSVSTYDAILPASQSTDATTDPGTVKRKKPRRFKKIANTKVMMWLMHKH